MTGTALAKCLELAREGIRNEELGMKVDRMGSSPDAAERYKRAAENLNYAAATGAYSMDKASKLASELAKTAEDFASSVASDSSGNAVILYKKAIAKLSEAAAICPENHDNKDNLENHIAEIEVRIMYLESLDGLPPTVAVEDHIGKLSLSSVEAVSATDEEVAAVATEHIAPQSSSDSMAPPTIETPSSSLADSKIAPSPDVAKNQADDNVQPSQNKVDAVPNPSQPRLSDGDFLKRATEMERMGHDLESKNRLDEALTTFTNCLELYAILQKREKIPKVKECLRARMAELLDHAEVLKARITLGAP